MTPVLEFTMSDSSIGLTVRPTRSGPENNLTQEFMHKYIEVLKDRKRHNALFYEPLLPTGFPDIVVATYNPKVFEEWNEDRKQLFVIDFKILYHLHFVHGSKAEHIESQLGINSKTLVRSLERLLAAGLVRWYAKQWMPRSLKARYAISSIVAIEAKMKNWQDAFKQASMNQWFASESYVLLPIEKPNKQIIKKSEKLGLGIYSMPTGKKPRTICRPNRGLLPSSYASWFFNEWIGRRINS